MEIETDTKIQSNINITIDFPEIRESGLSQSFTK